MNATSAVLLLHKLNEATELDSAIPTTLTREHVRVGSDVLEITLILVKHAAEQCRNTFRSMSTDHHLEEILICLFFQDDTHGAFWFLDSTTATTSFNVRLSEQDAATDSDGSYPNLLWVAASSDCLIHQLIDKLSDPLATFLVKTSEDVLGVDDWRIADASSDSVELPLTVVHVLLNTSDSVTVRLLMSSRVEANRI